MTDIFDEEEEMAVAGANNCSSDNIFSLDNSFGADLNDDQHEEEKQKQDISGDCGGASFFFKRSMSAQYTQSEFEDTQNILSEKHHS